MTDQKQSNSVPIIVAVIGVMGVTITAIAMIIAAVINNLPPVTSPTPTPISGGVPLEARLNIRIANDKAEALQGAKVVFTTDQGLYPQFSDVYGNASITAYFQKKEGRLFVETKQYAVYDQIISLPMTGLVDVRLSPRDSNNRNVIIRASNGSNSLPVEGAQITLIVSDKVYSQPTDSNGITKFLLGFGGADELDADISVKTREYEFTHLRITLQAERIQDILIDPTGITTPTSVTP